MSALGIAGCGLLGFVVAALLRIAVRRTPALVDAGPLAPPMLLETLTAILVSTLAWHIGARLELLAYSWFAAVGVLLAAIDWRTRRLPTRLIWPSGGVLAGLFIVAAVVDDAWSQLWRSAAAMLVLLAFYGVLYVVRPGELGGGDLRLSAVLGLVLGWASWPTVVAGVLLGWLAAAAWLIALRLRHRADTPRELPLGPFMIVGAAAGLLVNPVG